MQFTTFALAALSLGLASAKSAASNVTVHVVKVGSSNGTLKYSPDNLTAAVGDMVQFQFAPANHTVTQSTFDQPCQPVAMNSNVTGIFSGFMPVSASATTAPTYTIMVNNTTPMWLYCSQGKHCQAGMVMVINEAPAKNATRTLANYAALAKKATANLAPGSSSSGSSGSGSATSSSSGSKSSATSTGSASKTSGTSSATSTGGASSFKPSEVLSLAGVAVGMALFL
ncbi:hypothetical protein BP6252_06102 [Coleophoma cylindrospora]|uniref:Phytocyanin domain-containing protein n=1 Tax=Coleophoma cylindrospora TaxID=1849047 RepID=A0A3D8RLY6_9HELO|nr:hypothetical protein BP6252_06102 [Coleophoma cylindrospora]